MKKTQYLGVYLLSLITLAISQRISQRRPPPPPPGAQTISSGSRGPPPQRPPTPPRGMRDQVTSSDASVRIASRTTSGQTTSSFTSPSSRLKLIFDENCGRFGEWVFVTPDTCPVAFEDPNFSTLGYICGWTPFSNCRDSEEFEAMWTYPELEFCQNVPVCLACPELGKCGPRGRSTCECLPSPVMWNRQVIDRGFCSSEWAFMGQRWCYVRSDSACGDVQPSTNFPGLTWSYQACRSF